MVAWCKPLKFFRRVWEQRRVEPHPLPPHSVFITPRVLIALWLQGCLELALGKSVELTIEDP